MQYEHLTSSKSIGGQHLYGLSGGRPSVRCPSVQLSFAIVKYEMRWLTYSLDASALWISKCMETDGVYSVTAAADRVSPIVDNVSLVLRGTAYETRTIIAPPLLSIGSTY